MNTRTLGKLFGVEVKIHGTFLIFLAFLAISGLLRGGLFQALVGLGLSAIVFSIIVAHEFGHIFAARKFGIRTHDVLLTPIGGMARLEGMPTKPSQEIAVAVAGPAVNLVLAGAGYLALPFITTASMPGLLLSALAGWFITVNLVLLGFNLIPALPMDGGRVLRAALSKKMGRVKATQTAAKVARWSALAMAVYAVATGQLTLLFIAGFVFVTSWMEVVQAQVQAAQQNPAFQVFRAFQSQSRQPGPQAQDAPYSRVVDQNGHPVGEAQWNVRNVRWADPS